MFDIVSFFPRTGLAVSDAMNILVGEAWTVNQWDANALADEIVKLAALCSRL